MALPGRIPDYATPVFIPGPDGKDTLNPLWWRFWSNLGTFAQNTGAQINICTQSGFPALNAANANTFIYVSDFAHWIFWDGSTPVFADGGNDYYAIAPTVPASVGWAEVNGATVNRLNPDGTTTPKVLTDVTGTPAFLRVGAGADTLNAPVAPALTMNSYTPAGSVTPAGNTTPLGAISAPIFTGTPQAFTTDKFTLDPAGSPALTGPTPITPAGVNSVPVLTGSPSALVGTPSALTGTPATLTGTIGATGQPENFYSKLWYRL